jgi:predicted nucleotidyltransferase
MLDLEQVDLPSLADALEDHSPGTTWWFDPRTGETRLEPAGSTRDQSLIPVEPIPSRDAYADMEAFILRVLDRRARDLLERAMAGRGAFRRFKDALLDFQDLREVWFAFHDARMERRAIGWLADHGLVERNVARREAERREDPPFPEEPESRNPLKIAEAVAADLRELYGGRVRRILLFGSWARGDAHPESDIDLLVVLDQVESPWEELRRMDETLWRHSFQNGVVISAVPIGEDDLRESTRPLLIRAQTEGRPIP